MKNIITTLISVSIGFTSMTLISCSESKEQTAEVKELSPKEKLFNESLVLMDEMADAIEKGDDKIGIAFSSSFK